MQHPKVCVSCIISLKAINQNENEINYNARHLQGAAKTDLILFMVGTSTFHMYCAFSELIKKGKKTGFATFSFYPAMATKPLSFLIFLHLKVESFDYKLLTSNDLSSPLSHFHSVVVVARADDKVCRTAQPVSAYY